MLSYWEKTIWTAPADVVIVGAGFTGLFTAITLLRNQPKLKVKLIEQEKFGTLASSRNAGFLCFGSPSELAADLGHSSPETIISLLRQKRRGISLLLAQLRKKDMQYQATHGYELLLNDFPESSQVAIDQYQKINTLFHEAFQTTAYYRLLAEMDLVHQSPAIQFKYEGQINPAATVLALRTLAENLGAHIMYNTKVLSVLKQANQWHINLGDSVLKAHDLVLANNAFASELASEHQVLPQRAQVLVTEPLSVSLPWKGNFHVDFGYLYFRNIGNQRILLGGARNTDFVAEQTARLELNPNIQEHLEAFLQNHLLPPGAPYQIADRWVGIMGFREPKKVPGLHVMPDGLVIVAGMNGMGAALGPALGEEAALHLLKVRYPGFRPQKRNGWLKI
ncbi:MAG: NAD(P)/FAD-dependent oxidoreductase [Bacteroidia bacterium]